MKIRFCSEPIYNQTVAPYSATWPDNTDVVPCAKICSGLMIVIWIKTEINPRQIWIVSDRKSLMKSITGPCPSLVLGQRYDYLFTPVLVK